MAVIDGLPGVEFTVRINGSEEACTEYDDPDPPRSKVSSGSATHSVFKVIESQDDATFAIHLVVQNRKRWIKKTKGLAVIVYIDGHLVASKAYRHMHCDGKTLQCHFDGIETESANPGMTTIKNFCFSPIKTVEDRPDRFVEDKKTAEHLGIIEITLSRVKVHGASQPRKWAHRSQTELAEKALKGKNLSHGTTFSGEREIKKSECVSATNLDGNKRIARFFFRYKSKAALQIDGLIPREPSPLPTPPPDGRWFVHFRD
ncbi:hypothetical protein EsH8_VII_000131 [Colletotrichum jinshuiense]